MFKLKRILKEVFFVIISRNKVKIIEKCYMQSLNNFLDQFQKVKSIEWRKQKRYKIIW